MGLTITNETFSVQPPVSPSVGPFTAMVNSPTIEITLDVIIDPASPSVPVPLDDQQWSLGFVQTVKFDAVHAEWGKVTADRSFRLEVLDSELLPRPFVALQQAVSFNPNAVAQIVSIQPCRPLGLGPKGLVEVFDFAKGTPIYRPVPSASFSYNDMPRIEVPKEKKNSSLTLFQRLISISPWFCAIDINQTLIPLAKFKDITLFVECKFASVPMGQRLFTTPPLAFTWDTKPGVHTNPTAFNSPGSSTVLPPPTLFPSSKPVVTGPLANERIFFLP